MTGHPERDTDACRCIRHGASLQWEATCPVHPLPGAYPLRDPDAERIAARFHEVYEALAPDHGYETREKLLSITRGLMVSENLGDVHDQINRLHDVLGLPHPEGDFLDGWTDQDWRNVGRDR